MFGNEYNGQAFMLLLDWTVLEVQGGVCSYSFGFWRMARGQHGD
jgi:hypothetical protein